MAITVPEKRNAILQVDGGGTDVTAIERSVRSGTWLDAARLQCWIAGRGTSVVPAHHPFVSLASGESTDLRYWIAPRYADTRYAYHLSMIGRASVTIDGVTTEIPGSYDFTRPPITTTILSDRAAQSTAEAELSITVEAVGGSLAVQCVAIEAVPRTRLVADDDLGVERARLWARQPIQSEPLSTRMMALQASLRASARRAGLFQYSRGTLKPWTSSSGTAADMFGDGIALLARKLFDGQTRSVVSSYATRWAVLAMCSDSTTAGEAVLTGTKGGSSSIVIPANTTSWTWFSSEEFECDVEDNASANGYQSGTPDEHNIALRRTAGSGTVSVASVSLYDVGE